MAYKSHCPCLLMLVLMLMATMTWPTTRAFGFFSGPQYTFKDPNVKDTRHTRKENWEPSSLWWRNRRSADPFSLPSQTSMTHIPLSMPLPLSELASYRASTKTPWLPPLKQPLADNLGPEENRLEILLNAMNGKHKFNTKPLFLSKVHLSPKLKVKDPLVLKKIMNKLRKMKQIKNALRVRDNSDPLLDSESTEINSVNPKVLLSSTVDQLQKMELGNKKLANTMKSRRAKLRRNSYGQYGYPTQQNHMGPPASKLSLSASKFAYQPPAQEFPAVEWFSSPREKPQPPSSDLFQEYIPPSFLESGPGKHSDSSNYRNDKAVEGMFRDGAHSEQFSDLSFEPINSFADGPVQPGYHTLQEDPSVSFPSSHTVAKPYKQKDELMVGFWGDGGFQNEDEDCENISTKVCYTDQDCLCHGFYVCSQGHCDIKSKSISTPILRKWKPGRQPRYLEAKPILQDAKLKEVGVENDNLATAISNTTKNDRLAPRGTRHRLTLDSPSAMTPETRWPIMFSSCPTKKSIQNILNKIGIFENSHI